MKTSAPITTRTMKKMIAPLTRASTPPPPLAERQDDASWHFQSTETVTKGSTDEDISVTPPTPPTPLEEEEGEEEGVPKGEEEEGVEASLTVASPLSHTCREGEVETIIHASLSATPPVLFPASSRPPLPPLPPRPSRPFLPSLPSRLLPSPPSIPCNHPTAPPLLPSLSSSSLFPPPPPSRLLLLLRASAVADAGGHGT